MNKFEILSQNVSRRPEAQSSRTASSALDAKAKDTAQSGGDDFSSVLSGLSDDAQQGETALSALKANATINEGSPELRSTLDVSSQSVGDLLQIFVTEGASEGSNAQQTSAQTGSSILSALQECLPRILVENGSRPNVDPGRAGAIPLRPNALAMSGNADDAGLLNSTPPSGLKVAVQHQETHFRPVIEGFSLKSDAEGKSQAEGVKMPKVGPAAFGVANGVRDDFDLNLPAEGLGTKSEEKVRFKEALAERQAARMEMTPRPAEHGAKAESAQSLPPGMLHRIAGAIIAEGRAILAETGMNQPHFDSGALLNSTRAADGVLRVLKLQLHPAELGVVTISMKLAGESLEMDLQVSSEETAQLLRSDSEKLSNILKGSGYRPDVINITVGPPETSQTDSGASQRQQFQSQSQHQSGAGQEGRPRQQDHQTVYETRGDRSDAKEVGASVDRSSSGVYL